MMMDHLDARKKKAKIVWRDWEELQKPGKWHKNMIKDWVRTTFNPLEVILSVNSLGA